MKVVNANMLNIKALETNQLLLNSAWHLGLEIHYKISILIGNCKTKNMINQKLEQNIYLVGFMAAGKSTVGKILAEAINFHFIDLDDWIEKEEKQSISSMFSEKGEAFFRERERLYLQKTINFQRYVIATGGGTPCYFDNVTNIKALGTSFYLQNSPRFLAQRLMNQKAKRPLLNDFERLDEIAFFVKQKLQEREKFYEQADIKIHCTDKNIKNIVAEILFYLK